MSQLRIDHAHSRLEHPAWAAAVIAQLKDEEVLVKRRHRPDAGRPDERPPRGRPWPWIHSGRAAAMNEQQDAKSLPAWWHMPAHLYVCRT